MYAHSMISPKGELLVMFILTMRILGIELLLQQFDLLGEGCENRDKWR